MIKKIKEWIFGRPKNKNTHCRECGEKADIESGCYCDGCLSKYL